MNKLVQRASFSPIFVSFFKQQTFVSFIGQCFFKFIGMASRTWPEVLLQDRLSFSASVTPGGEGDDRMSDRNKRLRRSPTDSVMRMTACTVRPYISSPLTCSVNSFSMDDSFRRLATASTTWSQIPASATVRPLLSDSTGLLFSFKPPSKATRHKQGFRPKGKKPERVQQGCCHLVRGGDSVLLSYVM